MAAVLTAAFKGDTVGVADEQIGITGSSVCRDGLARRWSM